MSLRSDANDAIIEMLCGAIKKAAKNGSYDLDLNLYEEYTSEFNPIIKEYFEDEEDFEINNSGVASW